MGGVGSDEVPNDCHGRAKKKTLCNNFSVIHLLLESRRIWNSELAVNITRM